MIFADLVILGNERSSQQLALWKREMKLAVPLLLPYSSMTPYNNKHISLFHMLLLLLSRFSHVRLCATP